MATKVFQRGNFIVVEKDSKETIIPIDNFEYDFLTPTTLKLKDVQEKHEISDSLANIQDEAGSPVGSIAAVDTYFSTFIKQSSAAAPVGGSTAANQVILNDQTAAKQIGYVLDIGAIGSIPPYSDVLELIQTIRGIPVSSPISQVAENTTQLAEIFNDVQTEIFYSAIDSSSLYFVPVNCDISDITQLSFEDSSEGNFVFNAPFTNTTDIQTGALHQLVELMQKSLTIQKVSIKSGFTPVPVRLVNPVNQVYTGFRYISYECDGADDAITVTQAANAITYPHLTTKGVYITGREIPMLTDKSTNSITFDGTGTVEIQIVY